MCAGRRSPSVSIVILVSTFALLLLAMPAWGAPGHGSGVPSGAKSSTGCLPSPFDASLIKQPHTLMRGVPAVIPAAVDLSAWLPPVGDRGDTLGVVAWASTYYAKTMMEKREHPSWDLSDPRYQFSPAWTYNQTNDCGTDSGAFLSSAVRLLTQRGAVDMAEMPFAEGDVATQPLRRQFQAAKPYRNLDDGAFWIRHDFPPFATPNPIDDVKAWLAAGNPFVIAFPLLDGFPGVDGAPPVHYFDNDAGWLNGWDAMCVVGYDDNANPTGADADHRGGFKIVNSSGTDWNGPDRGFIYVSYDFMKRWVIEAWWMVDAGPDGPVLDSISTYQANAGGAVTLRGSNFGALRGAARVSFNGVDATAMGYSNERVTVMVPEGATSGPLTLYDWEGNATASFPFTVGGLEWSSASVNSTSPAKCTTGTTVTVSARGEGFSAGSQLYLSDRAGLWIPANEQVVSGSTSVSGVFDLRGVLPGRYIVMLRTTAGQTASTYQPMIVRDGVDTFEPNDSRRTAHGPVKSGTTHSSYISTIGDDDFYKVKVPRRGGTITATLSGIPDFCRYGLSLCDASGKVLASAENDQQSAETVSQVRVRAGTYYVLVSQAWNCDRFQPYALKVTVR